MSTRNNHHSDLTVADVMLPMEKTPKTSGRTLLKEALELMDKHRLGIVCISDSDGTLQGIITDGDIRRMLSNVQKPLAALMSDDVIVHAIKSPTTVTASMSLQDAIDIMGKNKFGICLWSTKASCEDYCIFIQPSMLLLERHNDNEYN